MIGRQRSDPAIAPVEPVEPLTLADELLALAAMLRGIASGRPLNRNEASRYTVARLRLLQSDLQPVLPGFLYQCVSLLRFKDFITLYDPEIAHRERFLHRTLAPARAALGLDDAAALGVSDGQPAAAPARSSANWMR